MTAALKCHIAPPRNKIDPLVTNRPRREHRPEVVGMQAHVRDGNGFPFVIEQGHLLVSISRLSRVDKKSSQLCYNVQGGWSGCHTGNGEKLSNSQVYCLA